jgi:transcriptional regulator with XRE-family HTH domain
MCRETSAIELLRLSRKYRGVAAAVARDLGLSRCHISAVLSGRRSSPRVEAALLEQIRQIDRRDAKGEEKPMSPEESKPAAPALEELSSHAQADTPALIASLLPKTLRFTLDLPLRLHDAATVTVEAFAMRFVAFLNRNASACPYCECHVESLRKPGNSVYCRPCKCRLYRGPLPPAWRKA